MLPQLTKYFVEFHQVHVPFIGTIRAVQKPASLDVAARLMHPPFFEIRFSEDGWLTRHQLWDIGSQLQLDETATRNLLEEEGTNLQKAIERRPVVWNGVGTFSYTNGSLHFEPLQRDAILPAIPAERVLREGVQHSVLVGDQMMLSNGHEEAYEGTERHWNWSQIAGWSIAILALFFILLYLYQHQFSATASGLRRNLTTEPPPATYVQ